MNGSSPLPTRSGVSLPRLVAALALWPFLEQVLSFLVGFVDTALAGRLSVEATNAVGAGAYMLWLIGMLHGAVGVGAAALVARHTGGGRREEAGAAFAQAVLVATAGGMATALMLWVLAPRLAWMAGLREESAAACVLYLRILSLAGPFHAFLFVASACLRASGEMKLPFRIMAGVNLINAGSSFFLVMGPPPLGGYGIAGLAAGTLLAWMAGALYLAGVIIRRPEFGFGPSGRWRLEWPVIRRIFRIGVPNLGESIGLWAGNFALLVMVGHLPDGAAVGAHIVAIRIEALSFLPGVALATAASTLAGQFLGARDPAKARRAVRLCAGYGMVFMSAMGLLFILLPGPLVRLVTDQPVFLDSAPPLLFIVGWVQAGFALAIVLSGGLRGAGDTRSCMLITFGSTYLLRVPLAWFVGIQLGYGLTGIWIALSVEIMVRGILFLIRFWGEGWTRVKI